jgi:hypothetical protein
MRKSRLRYVWLFPALLTAVPDLHAQDERWRGIFTIYAFADYIVTKPDRGEFAVSFPYALRDRVTGASTTLNFNSNRTNTTGSGRFANPGFGAEIGKGHFSIEGAMGIYINQWSDNLYFGINYRFILKKFPVQTDRYVFPARSFPSGKFIRGLWNFPVKISLGVYYWQPLYKLGEIPVGDNQFSALGQTMQSLDSGQVGTTGTVTVYFQQNIIAFTPNITLGYRPINGRIDVSFRVAPFITFAQKGGLRFYLTNSGVVDWRPTDGISLEGFVPLSTVNLDATYNGEEINSTPFRLGCVMFTVKVGLRVF